MTVTTVAPKRVTCAEQEILVGGAEKQEACEDVRASTRRQNTWGAPGPMSGATQASDGKPRRRAESRPGQITDRPRVLPLSAGARLRPYQIVAMIGAGGMGEVRRARDTTRGHEHRRTRSVYASPFIGVRAPWESSGF
jgi:hypothetical protein